LEKIRNEFQNKLVPHTPESRLETAREVEQLRQKDTKHLEKKKPKERILVGADGRIFQKNEGKWDYKWEDTMKCVRLVVEISKFLDTSNIKIDCHRGYITIMIKDKVLQLLFEENVVCDTMYCERSKLNGKLAVTLQKESFKGEIDVTKELNKVAFDVSVAKATKKEVCFKRYGKLFTPSEVVDIRNILKNAQNTKKKAFVEVGGITEKQKIKESLEEDFVDDLSVPPLC
jgi:hypothetical protein